MHSKTLHLICQLILIKHHKNIANKSFSRKFYEQYNKNDNKNHYRIKNNLSVTLLWDRRNLGKFTESIEREQTEQGDRYGKQFNSHKSAITRKKIHKITI